VAQQLSGMISIWEKETFFAPQDIIIIGSGFVGLWSAFQLKRKNPALRVTILEAGLMPAGASTRNAGFACFGSLSELVHDGNTIGTDAMLQLVEMRFKGIERIQKFFKPDKIDFELCGGYELYPSGTIAGKLDESIRYINTLLAPITKSKRTFKKCDSEITKAGFEHTAHLIKNKYEGALHSGKLLQALLQEVQGMGVQVLNGLPVKNYVYDNGTVHIETEQGLQFCARQMLVCTNAFAPALLPDVDVVPARGQVLLTSPIKGLPFSGTFHADEGYYYFRNLGNRVLLGGARNKAFEDERTHEAQVTPFIQQELERYLAAVILPNFKAQYTIEHRWSGIMAMGGGKIPIVGELAPGVFAAVRMSGMGVALAPVVAQQVANMLLA
jgi:gamma-glutamylputrescine oxidase